MNNNTIEIARRLAELGQKEQAQQAYFLVLQQAAEKQPELEMEAASYIFFSEGDYQIAYTTFISLYNRGFYQTELMDLMTQAFYLPNVDKQRKLYEQNCGRLNRYRYMFRKDFLSFENLPIMFFPFNDEGYIPFYKAENRFGEYVNFSNPVIDRYFFKDLENPILATDVYSQYHLEYLNDTVRKSEWVGRENHIYLHYSNWATFCAHLQCLSFGGLLRDSKQVFLIENEIEQYPIDFKERFGIDYSKFPLRPIGIREINRLIWHTQLSAHNGGDFFNEILYGHPNLLAYESVLFDDLIQCIAENKEALKKVKLKKADAVVRSLMELRNPTDKDIFVALFLSTEDINRDVDRYSRIAPALLFQPHFTRCHYELRTNEDGTKAIIFSDDYERIKESSLFQQFKYIKTFTPMRRITTSYAAIIRFSTDENEQEKGAVMGDRMADCISNRSFMIDWQDRLFKDSILVRFEDGKLNPKATFTALAEFLDIPYTESMTYCSGRTGLNPESMKGNVRGFDPATVYRTYDKFANDDERAFIEYFMRDAYEYYGYGFNYYKGEPVDEEWIKEHIKGFTCINHFIEHSWEESLRSGNDWSEETLDANVKSITESNNENRLRISELLMHGLRFVNKRGQPLHMMKPLKLDPALLEQPLYH